MAERAGRDASSRSLSRYRPYLSPESLSMSVNLRSAWGRLFPMPALLFFYLPLLSLSLSPVPLGWVRGKNTERENEGLRGRAGFDSSRWVEVFVSILVIVTGQKANELVRMKSV